MILRPAETSSRPSLRRRPRSLTGGRRLLPAAAVAVALIATTPGGAAGTPGPVGTASRYGLDRNFTLVGHTDLAQRGMNSPLAVAGRCAYIGDRSYDTTPRANAGIAIVDVTHPSAPVQVNRIPAQPDSTARELRADAGLGLLVVENYSPYINATTGNSLDVYDIRTCTKPRLLSHTDFGVRTPHEFFLWKDRAHPGRALAFVTFTIRTPDLVVYDLSTPTSPTIAATYDALADHAYKAQDFADESGSGYLHSISVSDDGTRAYLSTWDYGLLTVDTSRLTTPSSVPQPILPLSPLPLQTGHNVHSSVVLPGRSIVTLGQEDYANAGHGCPFGTLRTARVAPDGSSASLLGQFSLPENDPATCGTKNGTFSAHNQTTFPDVVLLSWYAGGLRAVNVADPSHLSEGGAFVPTPTFTPAERDARLFFPGAPAGAVDPNRPLPTDSRVGYSTQPKWTGAMWSYPVVQNGLIYVVDIDLGLFILRYTGPHASEVSHAAFVEGNSAPSRYSRSVPAVVRPAASWAHIDAVMAAQHGVARSLVADLPPAGLSFRGHLPAHGFLCG